VAYNYLTTNGVIVPDTSVLKGTVQGEYKKALGDALLLADDTPQGRMIDTEVTARDGVVRLAAELANQINPNVGSGIFLESTCALHAVIPTAESSTLLPGVLCTGTPNTIILSGSRIADEAGNYYASVSELTIGVGGTVIGNFQAIEPGPLNPGTGTVTTIVDGTFGWVEVTNPNIAVPGALTEDDNTLRIMRNERLSNLSKGPIEAINSNVMSVPGVRSVSIRENVEPGTTTVDGVVLSPHSTWICVQGGVDAEIAQALVKSKHSGSPYTTGTDNGTPVLISIVDPISGQTYPVIYTRQIEVPVALRVTVTSGSTTDPDVAVPDALLAYAEGRLTGERGFINGADVSPFECATAVNKQYPGLFVKNVEVKLSAAVDWSNASLAIELWQAATLASGDIFVVQTSGS
jgi:uncharacterized phage protein gp47/JayE